MRLAACSWLGGMLSASSRSAASQILLSPNCSGTPEIFFVGGRLKTLSKLSEPDASTRQTGQAVWHAKTRVVWATIQLVPTPGSAPAKTTCLADPDFDKNKRWTTLLKDSKIGGLRFGRLYDAETRRGSCWIAGGGTNPSLSRRCNSSKFLLMLRAGLDRW